MKARTHRLRIAARVLHNASLWGPFRPGLVKAWVPAPYVRWIETANDTPPARHY